MGEKGNDIVRVVSDLSGMNYQREKKSEEITPLRSVYLREKGGPGYRIEYVARGSPVLGTLRGGGQTSKGGEREGKKKIGSSRASRARGGGGCYSEEHAPGTHFSVWGKKGK